MTIGNDPNSVANIIGDLLEIGDAGTNTYAVRTFSSRNEQPWEMTIDNNATQIDAIKYTG